MGVSRRDFLKNSGLVVMAGSAYLTTEQWLRGDDGSKDFLKKFDGKALPTAPNASSAAEAARDSRLEAPTIVTIFLRGGCDSLNAIVPYGDDGYYRPAPASPSPSSPRTARPSSSSTRRSATTTSASTPTWRGSRS